MAILNSKEKLMMEQKSLNAIIIFSVTLVLLSASITLMNVN